MEKWNLSYLVKSEEEFRERLLDANTYIEKLASYQGKLSSQKNFAEFQNLSLEFTKKFYPLYQFASLRSDLNKKNVENARALSEVSIIMHKLSAALSFVDPEILSIGEDKIMAFIDADKSLEQFRFEYQKLFRQNEHVLDAESEKLLSHFQHVRNQGSKLYSALAVADGVSHKVDLSYAKDVAVNQSNYRGLIADSQNALDRQKIFEAIFNDFEANKHTFATIYENVLQNNKAFAKARNYPTILDSYLFRNNIPTSVYYNLVKVAQTENEMLKKYYRIKKEYLGLEKYHSYDRFIEFAKSDKKYSYPEAKELFFASLSNFPQEFQDKAHEALALGFVDVEPQDGKRTGAYSSSMPDTHPFILLNYTNTLDDVFTVAHEAGHSMHSMFAQDAQPTNEQDYTIFVAEIASTFNEHVLLDYLMQSPSVDKNEKIGLLQKAIDNIASTFYRQALFANYELEAHKLVENDQPINYQVLSNIMIDLYQKYYDIDIREEKVKEYVWAYIPHLFYTPFYVYQYATSFAASFKIYKDVKEKVPNAFDKYLGLLKSGGSKYPVDQAKEAGVDFTTLDPFLAVVERLEYLVNELEKLLK